MRDRDEEKEAISATDMAMVVLLILAGMGFAISTGSTPIVLLIGAIAIVGGIVKATASSRRQRSRRAE